MSSSSNLSSLIEAFQSSPPLGKKVVLLFWAPWHEASIVGGPMDQVLQALARQQQQQQQHNTNNNSNDDKSSSITFGRVEAERVPNVCEQYGVTVVPTFVLLDAQGQVVQRIEGTDDTVAQVTQAVQQLAKATTSVSSITNNIPTTTSTTASSINNDPSSSSSLLSPEQRLSKRLDGLIGLAEVMVFMKGTPTAPKCGFSRQVVELLQEEDIPFASFNILADDDVRQGLKQHSNWPTYPQLYVRGELIGGLDILKELKEQGSSLVDQLGVKPLSSTSAATTSALPAAAAETTPSSPEPTLEERLSQLVRRHDVMLFMKGLPSAPKCGFSRKLVELLQAQGVAFDAFDILQDDEVRQGLKSFSNWPTFPQLYVHGELVGGLDICQEMAESGELAELLTVPQQQGGK